MIKLRDVSLRFDGRTILDAVDLDVLPGEIVAVVGPNGSGKTSLLDIVGGDLPADGVRQVEAELGRAFQDDELFPSLTVSEALSAAGGDGATLARFGLESHADRWPSELSTGIRRVVEIALATSRRPDVLLLDEPSAGLARAEVDNLARVIRQWREDTSRAVLLVEHDVDLVTAVADRVLQLRDGRLVSLRSSPDPALHDDEVAVDSTLADWTPRPIEPLMPMVSIWRLARWGLREFAAGLLSVLVVGVLNRVMAVELGVSLTAVSLVVGGYNLAAPFALPLGHRSDRQPLFGRRRSGYVVVGAALTGLAACFAPDAAYLIAESGTAPWAVALGISLFGLMGLGMYGSGTAFFALLADQCPPNDRARAAAVVYSELMLGILAGVGLTAIVLDGAGRGELRALFIIVGVTVGVLTALAVWGTEPRVDRSALASSVQGATFRSAVRAFAARSEARRLFAFLLVATTALFLQQTILEPFGGIVLGLSVDQSTGFNAVLIIGVLAGMGTGSRMVAPRVGIIGLGAAGLVVAATGFSALALGAFLASGAIVWPALAVLGFGTGLFNVAGLSLMMQLSRPGAVGLAMGAWTLSHAIADGLATAGGGAAYDGVRFITGAAPGTTFATVFAVEGLMLLLLLPLLAGLGREEGESEPPIQLEDAELHAP